MLASPAVTTAPSVVLIIDDDPEVADCLAFLLRAFGHLVTVAGGALDAVEVALREESSVIIVGLRVEGDDRCEVARRLRAAGCGARLVALTTRCGDLDRAHSAAAGFDRHLLKPAKAVDLLEAMGLPPLVATP